MVSNIIKSCICNQSSDVTSSIKVNQISTTIQPQNINSTFESIIQPKEKLINNFKYDNSNLKSLSNNERSQKSKNSIKFSKFSSSISPVPSNGILQRNTFDKSVINQKIKQKFGTFKHNNFTGKIINEQVIFKKFKDKVDFIIQDFLIKKTVSESDDSERIIEN